MTTFGDQLYQHGGSPVGLPYSYLKGPNGQVLFVAPARSTGTHNNNASDTNPGTLARPLLTIAAAYAKCTGGLGEIIYILGYTNTAADVTDDWSVGVTWAKNSVHLIGLVAPTVVSQRVRINQLSTVTGISPLLLVSGNNNVFANFQIFQGVADATSLINVKVTGQRNVFDNVHIAGIGHATMVTAGARSLVLTGAAENVFKNCTIGVDTIIADNTVTDLELLSGALRNLFEDCLFDREISNAGFASVTVTGATGIDRWIRFRRCTFLTLSVNDAVSQTSVFSLPALTQGYILLEDCSALTPGASGTGDWDSNNRGHLYNDRVAPAAAAVGGIFTKQ